MSTNLPYIKGTSEKLQYILKSHKIRSTFYMKVLCANFFVNKMMEQLQKINMVSETDCSNCEAVHFDKSKWSLKSGLDKQKRSVGNCDWENTENAKHC